MEDKTELLQQLQIDRSAQPEPQGISALQLVLIMAVLIGFVSGLFPAWRSARVPVVLAFRADH